MHYYLHGRNIKGWGKNYLQKSITINRNVLHYKNLKNNDMTSK